jgi:long-chain fatty acid transport protein
MKRINKLTSTGVVLASAALTAQSLQAGGIILYELATPDLGLASAGYAARADDASTLFKNPAGMSRLEDAQLQTGLQALYGSVSFSPNASTSPALGTDGGGNALGWLPGASLFVVEPLGDRWRVGLGVLSYFGLASSYDDNWVGRYYVQNSALLGVSLMPSVSFKATDWLSFGAGLNAMYGYLNTELAVNRGPLTDGQMKLNDRTWGFGANAGVLVQASERTRFGVTYLSALNLDFATAPSFQNFVPPNGRKLDLGMTVPQSVMLSGYHELNDHWALMANAGWQDWSQFGYVQAGFEGGNTVTAKLDYQDTWHGAVGAQYRGLEQWVFSGGVAFDSSAVKNANRTVTLPMGQAWRFGLGAQYQLSSSVNLGAAYEFVWGGNLPVDQGTDGSLRGRVAGTYEDTWQSFFSLNLTWKF